MRDDFSKSTVEKLAKRAGYLCSKPDCGLPTIGAAQGHEGVMNLGVAAHITAASPGGPRFDATLTSEERRDAANGIWLCQTHGKLVDADGDHFTVEMLRAWKRQAEERSFRLLVESGVGGAGKVQKPPAPLEEILGRLIASAIRDLSAFKRMAWWPRHGVALNLRTPDDAGHTFTTADLAKALPTFGQPIVVAPAGTGKTTTLVQLSDQILALGQQVALFVPLGEWASQTESFMRSVCRRQAFAGAEDNLVRLAQEGRITFVLDGWNELDALSRKRASDELKRVQRDFPDIGIVISTRRQALPLPLSGPVIEVNPLAEGQQIEIARALRGQDGDRILDHAWRTPGVRELVALPLYLTALLTDTTGATFPTTKDAILRIFVREHERLPDHSEALREVTLGFHSRILTALAANGVGSGVSTVPEIQARAVIGSVEDGLMAQRQITQTPQPMAILDALVNHHLLLRSGTGTVSFQHQQFQEWYASFEVESLMRSAASGDAGARQTLRSQRLDLRAWEEPILFACERLSNDNEPGPVAAAILEAMTIDPLLAAEMIFHSSEAVWQQVVNGIFGRIRRWHRPGTVDRAVAFMIRTGRPEFAGEIWPLISSSDTEVQVTALRANRPFRTTVLGPECERRIAGLLEPGRRTILTEIAHFGDLDGMELAARLAQQDASPKLKTEVIEALLFRRAERLAETILAHAPDEVWQSLAQEGYARQVTGATAARLRKERDALIERTADPFRRLHMIVQDGGIDVTSGAAIAAVIEREDFPGQDQHAAALIYRTHQRFPEAVNRALLTRLKQGQPIPFRAEDLLQGAGLELNEGPTVERALAGNSEEPLIAAAAAVFGQPTIARLMDALHALTQAAPVEGRDQAAWDRLNRLTRWISIAPTEPFIRVLLELPATSDPGEIAQRADLVARHRNSEEEGPLRLGDELKQRLTATIERWTPALLESGNTTRAQLAEVARSIGAVAAPELLSVLTQLLAEDLARWRRARTERNISPSARKDVNNWTLQYERAFAAIGSEEVVALMTTYLGDSDFGVSAASVIKTIWARDQTGASKRFVPGIDFSQVAERRLERQLGRGSARCSRLTEPILAAIERLTMPGMSDRDYQRALELATIAFSMPYGSHPALIDTLLLLPAPQRHRRNFLTVLVQAGEIISFDVVADEVKKLLEDAKAKPWLLDPNQSQLYDWLALLALSDSVQRVPEMIEILEPQYRYPWHLRALVVALGNSPDPAAEAALDAIARQQPALFRDHDWLTALSRRGTASAVRLLLDRMAEGVVTLNQGLDRWRISRTLAAAMERSSEVRRFIYDRFPTLPQALAKTVLEAAISEAADAEAILLLIREYAARERAFDGLLQEALRNVALGERASVNWSGAKEIVGVAVPHLRRELFGMLGSDARTAALAEAALNAIDELRDEYGGVEGEPRHPDVASERPWPRLPNKER